MCVCELGVKITDFFQKLKIILILRRNIFVPVRANTVRVTQTLKGAI